MLPRACPWIVLISLAAGCASQPDPAVRKQDTEVLQRFFSEVLEKHRLAAIDEFCTEDFVEHDAPPGVPPTREGVKTFFADWIQAFPDTKVVCQDFVVEGDKIVCRSTWTGTFQADFMGMKANGKGFHIQTIDILRIRNGKFVEHWGITDMATLMEQLK